VFHDGNRPSFLSISFLISQFEAQEVYFLFKVLFIPNLRFDIKRVLIIYRFAMLYIFALGLDEAFIALFQKVIWNILFKIYLKTI